MTAARRPRYTLHGGFRMPLGFPVAGFESGQRYRAEPSDVFVATYPKCGTTWAQYIVYLLLNGGRPLGAAESLNDVFPHLEEVGAEVVQALARPRLIKTHLAFERTPWQAEAKYVLVVRNPFDCAVSFYHHTRGFVRHYDFAAGTWDEFFECFIAGEVDFGDYFAHLLSWWPHRSAANVLFLIYEQMLAAPAEAITCIGGFLGGAAAALVANPAKLAAVERASSFPSMQADQDRWSSRRPVNMPAFVRKGVAGDWVHYFTREQQRRLIARCRAAAAGAGIEALWPGLLDDVQLE